jgi:hypothetical protein
MEKDKHKERRTSYTLVTTTINDEDNKSDWSGSGGASRWSESQSSLREGVW